MGRRSLVGFFLFFAGAILLAQHGPDDDPDSAPGYVNNVFHSSSVDSINLYNGQLTLPIPVGSSYPIGPNLKFQALLSYNSQVREYGNPGFQSSDWYNPLLGNPALGMGWNFQLGKLGGCGVPGAICFFGPDGSNVVFWTTDPLNPGYKRTGDASRYRLYAPSGLSGEAEMWDEAGNHYVFGHQVTGFDDDGNNYIHDFGRGRNGLYLTSLSDPFGNTMTVQYYASIPTPIWAYDSSSSCVATMRMQTPSAGVNTWIPHFINLPTGQIAVNLDGRGRISSFTFPVYVNGAATTRNWTLTYKPDVQRELYGRVCGGAVFNVYLEQITALTPPEIGSSYQFAYGSCGASGLLTQVTLPTGATIDYLYETYSFYHSRLARLAQCSAASPPSTAPVEASGLPFCGAGPGAPEGPDAPLIPPDPGDCTDEGRYEDKQTGVVRRTETVNGSSATTDYTQYAFPFGEQGSYTSQKGSQTLTIVLQPADVNGKRRAKSVLFWASPKESTTYSYGSRTGADIRDAVYECDANPHGECDLGRPPGLIAQPACGGANDYPFCPNHALRATQRTYEYYDQTNEKFNRRLQSETTYHQATASNGTCSGCKYHAVSYSQSAGKNWETTNNRHFNIETHTGTLGNDPRTIITSWTQVASAWLPNLYGRVTDTLGSSVLERFSYFDPANGFLKGTAVWDPGPGRIFAHCFYPPDPPTPNVGTPLYELTVTALGYPSPPTSYPCYASLADWPNGYIGTNGDLFGKQYTFQNGQLLAARWLIDKLPASWKAVDYTRAASTGWITFSRDSAGFQNEYRYDGLGRVTSIIAPGGEAATGVSYSPNQTVATRNGGAGLSTWEEYNYDGLGRLIKERRQVAALPTPPQLAKRFTKYDSLGSAYFTSEWVADSTSENLAPPDIPTNCVFSGVNYSAARPSGWPGTYRLCYDPFGRPQQVVGSKHSSLATVNRTNGSSFYSDTKEAITTYCVSGTLSTSSSCGSGAVVPNPVMTNERDAFGRLTKVTEPGLDETAYTYDVNDKLTGVSGVTPGSQSRSFVFNPAGFMNSETTPEKGLVTYSLYGSLGNVLSESPPGGLVLTRTYDFAGRLTGLSSNEGGSRTYLSNTYNNTTAGASLGKLTSRTATNYALTPSNTVTDTYAYDSATGRLSTLMTSVSGGSNLTTTQSWKYNGLGLLAHHYHPRPSGASPFVVSYAYDSGLPVKEYVNGIAMVTGVTYQASGAVSSYATGINTGKNMTTTVAQDPSLLARPSQIYATAEATGLRSFDTSGYVYDGGGNIKTIGSDTFTYDELSRLKIASYSGQTPQGHTYDRYGNLLSKGAATYSVSTSTNRLTTSTYDSRGNLTVNGGETYAYDGLDRQIRHTAAGSSWNYVFDGSSERVAKAPPAGGAWTYTLRDEGNRVATEYSGATQSRDNVFLGNLAVLSYSNSAVSGNGPVWTFYTSDHLGTPRLVTDIAGTTVETRKSWPYGEDVGAPGPFQKLRFALMERDIEASRYYDHARSHDFGLGRFLSPDELTGSAESPQSWNRYSYVEGNPIKSIDPDGEELRITTNDPVFRMHVARSLDRIQSISPRLFTLVDALRRSANLHQITENSYAEAGATTPTDPDAALGNQPTGSFVYVDPETAGFDSMLTHELSHAEDFDTGTADWKSECSGCASGIESKAVRMRNQLPENRAKPQRTYIDKKVKNPTQVPADPHKRSTGSNVRCTGEKKNCNAPSLH
jgi:RHS repeat-associated protein